MEIHAPKPPHSLKDFLLELLTITIGILIALSLEGVVQWVHHRHLVHEAEANLATEVAENQQEIRTTLQGLRTTRDQLSRVVDAIHQLQAHRTSRSFTNPTVNWTLSELHATSWNTAASTGALAYMGYPEVKRFTRVYDLQQEFMQMQSHTFDSAVNVYGLMPLAGKSASKITDSQLEAAERSTGIAIAAASGLMDIATALEKEYAGLAASSDHGSSP